MLLMNMLIESLDWVSCHLLCIMEVETGQIDKTDQWENGDFRQNKGLSLGNNVSKVTKQSCQQSTTKQKEKSEEKQQIPVKRNKKQRKTKQRKKQKDKSKATEQKEKRKITK